MVTVRRAPLPAASAATTDAVVVRELRKSFGSRVVLRGLSFEVRTGEVFAFLGPNGAGKTTTVEILEGYMTPSSGNVSVLGCDPSGAGREWRERVGIVLQESQPDPGLTVRQLIDLYAGYYKRPIDPSRALAAVGLLEDEGRRSTQLSGGRRRRLDLALALVGDPDLLFLDEPTVGFDPAARRAMWVTIEELRSHGKTIFLTTHYLEEAERLADRIGVIVAGRLVALDNAANLGGRSHGASEIRFCVGPALRAVDLPPLIGPLVVEATPDGVLLRTHQPVACLETLFSWAHGRGFEFTDLDVRRPTLEDVYLRLTDTESVGDVDDVTTSVGD
jgi:ABC-2 type transport system ATP-binding protein